VKIPCSGAVYNFEEMQNIREAALTFYNVEGDYTEAFKKGLEEYLGMKYCILTNSGSSANLLAVTALGLPKGSEVITTACGFPTTLNPIIQNNLSPVFVDIDETLTIDAIKLTNAIANTEAKAIIIAHTLGIPSDMDYIMYLAKEYDLMVIEDNCDALGSKINGRLTGTFGDISTLSFYPAHHMTTGEGGACLTNDYNLYRKMLSLRNWGRDCVCKPGQDNICGKRFKGKFGDMPKGYDHKYIYSNIGYNLKMTNIQASIGVAQLNKLDSFIAKRKSNFNMLYMGLSKYEKYFYSPLKYLSLTDEPSWFGYPIICKNKSLRDNLVSYLEEKGIATRMMFGGNLLRQPAYKNMSYKVIGDLDVTNLVTDSLFWIGVYPGITTDNIKYIIKTFNNFMRKNK